MLWQFVNVIYYCCFVFFLHLFLARNFWPFWLIARLRCCSAAALHNSSLWQNYLCAFLLPPVLLSFATVTWLSTLTLTLTRSSSREVEAAAVEATTFVCARVSYALALSGSALCLCARVLVAQWDGLTLTCSLLLSNALACTLISSLSLALPLSYVLTVACVCEWKKKLFIITFNCLDLFKTKTTICCVLLWCLCSTHTHSLTHTHLAIYSRLCTCFCCSGLPILWRSWHCFCRRCRRCVDCNYSIAHTPPTTLTATSASATQLCGICAQFKYVDKINGIVMVAAFLLLPLLSCLFISLFYLRFSIFFSFVLYIFYCILGRCLNFVVDFFALQHFGLFALFFSCMEILRCWNTF